MKDLVRIGCFAAFWGDTKLAISDILDGAEVDYLVADYLSEITMALLARAKAKDPEGGFIADFVATVAPVLPVIAERGIKVVCNAGALNPRAAARAFRAACAEAGVTLTVAAVEGDDILPRAAELARATDMFTGAPLPASPGSMNAYLGARPIAAALAAGADVVITGRAVDAAVVLGPLLHEFGWKDDEYDLLSAGSLVGHLVECGPQVTGGNSTDGDGIDGWDRMAYPVAEIRPDGTAVVTKPRGTSARITPLTVGEQMLYEIGDPGAYLLPDVVCDWRAVTLTQDGVDRVRVSGAKGSAPTTTYKVTATSVEGYRALTTAMFAGLRAAGKARRMAEALVARTDRLLAHRGFAPLSESSIEVIGAGDVSGAADPGPGTEAVVKIGVKHTDKAALEIFAGEFAPFALVAQGMTGVFAGRPRVAPAIAVHHLLVEKADTPVRVVIGASDGAERTFDVEIASGSPVAVTATERLPEDPAPVGGTTVPLVEIAVARSGDKGNLANIGIIARDPAHTGILRTQVTAERVAAHLAHLHPGEIRRYDVPGIGGVNIVVDDVLGGTGGTSTLRYDPQGKSYAAMLLSLPVSVPEATS
jgi:hypothetical protein